MPPAADLLLNPLLRTVPTIEGFKVLPPVVLYSELGRGGMGAVYRGHHVKLDLTVAVKCLKPELTIDNGVYAFTRGPLRSSSADAAVVFLSVS